MNFEYLKEIKLMDSIDIENIGKCYLQCNNDMADEWYLGIETSLGWTKIKQFGPLTIDSNIVSGGFGYSYYKTEYNEKKLHKTIYDFLNNDRRFITQAREIDKQEFYDRLENLEEEED